MEQITAEEARELIRGMVDQMGSQTLVAKDLGVSPTMISDILSGARNVSDKIAQKIGYSKVVVFVKQDWDVNS
jgi:predicted transcriptional regulator